MFHSMYDKYNILNEAILHNDNFTFDTRYILLLPVAATVKCCS